MKECDNIRGLARQLGIDKRLLYNWRDRATDLSDQRSPINRRKQKEGSEVKELKRLLAEKTLESDFFRGALQKVEARRRPSSAHGETASNPGSDALAGQEPEY
jgi:hypothetical protein